MAREIPGSSFEQGDDEDRTWDEMGIGRELWADDDDDYDQDDRDDAAAWDDVPDQRSVEEAWTAYRDLHAEIDRIRTTLSSRQAPVGYSYDPDEERLAELVGLSEDLEWHLRDDRSDLYPPDPDWRWWSEARGAGLPPADFTPRAPRPLVASPAAPRGRSLEDVLREILSNEQLRHFHWLLEGRTQSAIAAELGISQPAVAKREVLLRSRVDELSMRAIGRPYPWLRRSTARGGRPRRS